MDVASLAGMLMVILATLVGTDDQQAVCAFVSRRLEKPQRIAFGWRGGSLLR